MTVACRVGTLAEEDTADLPLGRRRHRLGQRRHACGCCDDGSDDPGHMHVGECVGRDVDIWC